MKIITNLAKPISYDSSKTRDWKSIKYIVIHYTGNSKDTAAGNASYFANTNTRQAGAHFFVDKAGKIYKSVNINRTAWAVGGSKYSDCATTGGGKYYGKCTNFNSVSIEMCDCLKDVGYKQMVAMRWLVKHIRELCPNADTIIRHFSVTGKSCPAPMTGTNNKKWNHLHCYLENGYLFKAKVTKKAAVRTSAKITAKNKIGKAEVGRIVFITKTVGNWGRLKNPTEDGKFKWISLSKLKEL